MAKFNPPQTASPTLPTAVVQRPGTIAFRIGRAMVGAALAAFSLGACASFLPLPLSPVQLLSGQWPPAVNAPGVARNYSIQGNLFSLPSVGLSVRRPNNEWRFLPLPTGVAMVLSNLTGTEPPPTFQLQLFITASPIDLGQQLTADLQQLAAAQAQVSQFRRKVVALDSIALRYVRRDPQTQLEVMNEQTYVLLASDALALITIAADPNTFTQLEGTWSQIVRSMVLPKAEGISSTADPKLPVVPDGSATATEAATSTPSATATPSATEAATSTPSATTTPPASGTATGGAIPAQPATAATETAGALRLLNTTHSKVGEGVWTGSL